MLIEVKDVITLLTGFAGSAVISKIIEARQAARKAIADAPIEKSKLELERKKTEDDAEEKFLKNLSAELEKESIKREKEELRHEAREAALEKEIKEERALREQFVKDERNLREQQVKDEQRLRDDMREKYQQKVDMLVQSNAEYQQEIKDLRARLDRYERQP